MSSCLFDFFFVRRCAVARPLWFWRKFDQRTGYGVFDRHWKIRNLDLASRVQEKACWASGRKRLLVVAFSAAKNFRLLFSFILQQNILKLFCESVQFWLVDGKVRKRIDDIRAVCHVNVILESNFFAPKTTMHSPHRKVQFGKLCRIFGFFRILDWSLHKPLLAAPWFSFPLLWPSKRSEPTFNNLETVEN